MIKTLSPTSASASDLFPYHEASFYGSIWAREHPELSNDYPNQYVVVVDKKVIAFGADAIEVGKSAAITLECPLNEVVVVWLSSPSTWDIHAAS
jgi:hypothetical protein